MENRCQLMMVPGVLVTVSAPACCEKTALPTATWAPFGRAHAAGTQAHAPAATAMSRRASRFTEPECNCPLTEPSPSPERSKRILSLAAAGNC